MSNTRPVTSPAAESAPMLTLDPRLAQRLRERSVRMEVSDRDTIVLRRVPTRDGRFNQPQTSLLVKRPRAGMPYVVSVSADLEYLGPDAAIAKAFRAGIPQNGWRTLMVTLPATLDPAAAMDAALAIVGFDDIEPRLPGRAGAPASHSDDHSPDGGSERRSPLDRFGIDLTALAENESADGETSDIESDDEMAPAARPSRVALGRDEELLDVLATLLSQRECRLPLVVGPSGAGKTNLVRAVAARLHTVAAERRVIAVNANEMVVGVTFEGEFENVFHELILDAESRPDVVLAVEHFELLLVSRLPRLLSEALDRGRLNILGTLLPEFAARVRDPLARRARQVRLPEPSRAALHEIVGRAAARCGASDASGRLVDVCCRAAVDLPGASPGRELALLEAAAARARLVGGALSPDGLFHAARRIAEGRESDEE